MDQRAKQVLNFLVVLKLCQDEIFGDAYYDINYRRNVISHPKDEDVNSLLEACKKILCSINEFDHPSNSFVNIHSATATFRTIFNARRGEEPVRFQIYQWKEARSTKGCWCGSWEHLCVCQHARKSWTCRWLALQERYAEKNL